MLERLVYLKSVYLLSDELFPLLTEADQLDNCIGLCSSKFARVHDDILKVIFKSWPEYSGTDGYPVSVDDKRSPIEQYDIAQHQDAMNKGAYGQKRLELYNYTATILNQVIEASNQQNDV